jgi:hypothetical protein
MMFKRFVQQVNGVVMAQYIQAYMLVKGHLSQSVKQLHASITLVFRSAVSLLRQLVHRVLKIKVLVVNLTIQALLIKQELITALTKLWGRGLQRLTTVHQIRQPAPTQSLRKKGKPVGITKSARSRTKESKIVQTHTARLLTQDGLKSQGLVKRLLQRVKQLLKIKH